MEPDVALRRPARLRPGRHVTLPGRGRTFIREVRGGPPARPPVVLLHGWAATADLNWAVAYEAIAEHFDVVAMDHRGHGRGLRTSAPFTLEDCADDVAALLVELGAGPAIVVGYSMGGPIAQLLWRRHRHVVAGLVLCATSDVFRDSARDRALFAAAAGAAVVARSRATRLVGRTAEIAVRRRRLVPAGVAGDLARHDWRLVIEAGRAVGRFDSRAWLPAVDVPAAAVTTLDDQVVPTRRQVAMATRLPLVANPVVTGGHSACLDRSTGFVDAVVVACRAVAGGGSQPCLDDAYLGGRRRIERSRALREGAYG